MMDFGRRVSSRKLTNDFQGSNKQLSVIVVRVSVINVFLYIVAAWIIPKSYITIRDSIFVAVLASKMISSVQNLQNCSTNGMRNI